MLTRSTASYILNKSNYAYDITAYENYFNRPLIKLSFFIVINSTLLCPLALHYVPVLLFTYLHNVLWSHQSRGCWWDAWRHHARIGSLFVYFRLLRQMTRRFHHRLPRRRPKQCYGLCNWHLSKASPFNKRTILITEGQFFISLFFFLLSSFFPHYMTQRHSRLTARVPLSFHILTSSVICYWTDVRRHEI